MNDVRGIGPIGALCGWCLVVLTLVNLPVAALGLWVEDGSIVGILLAFYPWFALVAVIPVAVVGVPAGLLVAHVLRNEPAEWRHVVAFAATGAVLSVAISLGLGVLTWSSAWPIAAVEGAIGAGGARWWTGRRIRRRIARVDAARTSSVAVDGCARMVP